MRRLKFVIAISAVCVAGCGGGGGDGTDQDLAEQTPSKPMITSFAPVPLANDVLPELLLPPERIDAAVGAAGMIVSSTHTEMSDDSATMEPRECLAVDGAAQAAVYADSGFTAMHDETLANGDDFTHFAQQAVVLFPDADRAKGFFDASAQQWPACKHYTHLQSGSLWDVGPIANKDGMLSATTTQSNAQEGGWACGRALTVNNNVIVDVNTCSANPAGSAVAIAAEIASRVDSPSSQR
ncbi:sensor domain-containing protein [Mycobacterium sp. 21AC1]|uniref:sensor domain-containing protein n=1 Tax=[Mycobacterium] appelbergii TaxID=2939269 RepID=UPI002938E37D|nr:sensor domain-containing protein [Mycobacterium sp. 21AC1]MDV3127981.1 sensor domain-containing protein [Mycobacterium sp. 21AC1]